MKAKTNSGLPEVVRDDWRNQAMSQACAFPSPFCESMSAIAMLRQVTAVHINQALHKRSSTTHIAGYDVRPQACASIFQTPSRFANVYARVPVRTTDWPLIVTVRVPDMTAYADEPSTFQKPIS